MKKQKPILFSTPMVQAILDVRKTQTRRIVKPQPVDTFENDGIKAIIFDKNGDEIGIPCPYGYPGDILWVRETFETDGLNFYYRADPGNDDPQWGPWKPSIHMPKSAARIWLEITKVRLERLHPISAIDCIAEGIRMSHDVEDPSVSLYYFYPCNDIRDDSYVFTPETSFASLWASINGWESWNANPWVWVVEFKRIESPYK